MITKMRIVCLNFHVHNLWLHKIAELTEAQKPLGETIEAVSNANAKLDECYRCREKLCRKVRTITERRCRRRLKMPSQNGTDL